MSKYEDDLKVCKACNLIYCVRNVILPEKVNETHGYNHSCYKSFTSVIKKHKDEYAEQLATQKAYVLCSLKKNSRRNFCYFVEIEIFLMKHGI